jgi:hypothetical protein
MLRKISAILVISFLIVYPAISLASTTDGTIDTTYKYAWGENIGWINFGTEGGNVHVTDSGLTGYAWSQNYGWINLSPSTSGVDNDGTGDLCGYAWGENLGWIDFANVSINSSGKFIGTAEGTISGTITFDCDNCDVRTDWRPASQRGGSHRSTTPPSGTSISINGGAATTDSISVTLSLAAANASEMIIANVPDFVGSSWESFTTSKTWTLISGNGSKTVYAQFKNSSDQSSVISDSITLNVSTPSGGTTAPTALTSPAPGESQEPEESLSLKAGDLVKIVDNPTVYYIGADNLRHIFPNEKVYYSYYPDFSQVITVALSDLQKYPLGSNMIFAPGTLVKLITSAKVYRVDAPNVLRWIVNEQVFHDLGYNFKMIQDLADVYWSDYIVGADITSAE